MLVVVYTLPKCNCNIAARIPGPANASASETRNIVVAVGVGRQRAGVHGQVVLQCLVVAPGALTGHEPQLHQPAGASFMNTSWVQGSPRSSNQWCSLPSIWISSPSLSRRGRGWWKVRRWRCDSHRPAPAIHWRSVSRDIVGS